MASGDLTMCVEGVSAGEMALIMLLCHVKFIWCGGVDGTNNGYNVIT